VTPPGDATVWLVILGLAAGTYALKAAGPMLLGGRVLPERTRVLVGVLPAGLLAALVAVSTLSDGGSLGVDARLAGLIAAAVALWRRAGFVTVVVVAAAATAVVRLLTG
jgi:branched-subunit amino acid transport protein